MRTRGLATIVVALLSTVICAVQPAQAQSSVATIADNWSLYASGVPVSGVLDRLGPMIYNGSTSSGWLQVRWENGTPQIAFNGLALNNVTVRNLGAQIQVSGFVIGQTTTAVKVGFWMSQQGMLVIQTSDFLGYDAQRLVIHPESGALALKSVCRCWGGDSTSKKKNCTDAQCNDAGTQCTTAGTQAYCQWRASLVVSDSR